MCQSEGLSLLQTERAYRAILLPSLDRGVGSRVKSDLYRSKYMKETRATCHADISLYFIAVALYSRGTQGKKVFQLFFGLFFCLVISFVSTKLDG